MRIYSMHKGEFVMVFIAFFACFGLGVFIGLAGKLYFFIFLANLNVGDILCLVYIKPRWPQTEKILDDFFS